MAEDNRPPTAGLEPIVLAMVVCDQIYMDPQTAKKSLLGIFHGLCAAQFQATVPFMSLFLVLTGGKGKIPIKINLIDAEEVRGPVMTVDVEMDLVEPRAVGELGLGLGPIIFPEAGEYRFQVYAYGTLLMERRVLLMGPPEKQHE